MRLLPALLLLAAVAAHADQLTLVVSGGKSITTWHGQADVQSVGLEWMRARSPRTDLGVSVAPHILWQPRSWFGYQFGDGNETVRALSATVIVRRRFWTDSTSLQPYIEAAAGPVWAEKQVPASTSRFNVKTEPGAGVVLAPRSRTPVLIGYRFAHISNGGYSPRNPGVNVSSLVLGITLRRSP